MSKPDQSEPAEPAVVAPFERPVGRQPAEAWMAAVKHGDMLRPKPLWNASEGQHKNRLPDPVQVLDVQGNVWGCQSGVLFTVRAYGGALRELDAGWFLPPNAGQESNHDH